MPDYDSASFSPPAPVAFVTLRNPNTKFGVADVPMLIDSGADVTLIPKPTVLQLGIDISQGADYELIGFGGETKFSPSVRVEMGFLSRTFRGHFLLSDSEWGIIGRNVLNAVAVVLDGPNLIWYELRA